MKFAIKILNAVMVVLLTVSIIGIVGVKIASTTILEEAYIHKMIQKSKYYENLHNEIKATFENYIGPSGLDENILDDICSVEDIQEDTEIILGNIYEGTGKKVNTDEIKKRIIDKINQKVNEQNEIITEKMQASINKFAETVADEYINTISHTEYEEKINDAYKKITKLVDISQKSLFITVAVIFVFLVILNIKSLYAIATSIGISMFSSGAFITIVYYIINAKVKISQLKILNDSISLVLQNILTDVLNSFVKIGWILVAIGTIAIIIGSIVKIINTEERKKKERKWKN